MGLFGNLFKGPAPSGSPLLTNDDYALSRLRHAIWGDWFYSYEIRMSPKLNGVFKNRAMSRSVYHADLAKCDCDDRREEDDSKIIPCHHIYRVALESGHLGQLIVNPKIEGMICGMRDPLYRALLNSVIERGYYSQPGKWNGSKKTFDELQQLGILQGAPERYALTSFFRENAAAFVYYAMLDPRRYVGRELLPGEYVPGRQCLRYQGK